MDNNHRYKELVKSIEHWNEYRVPILHLSQPDKDMNFRGAMRFYFQDAGQKVATKCVNVTSADTTKDVIDVLIEKFRPDMRMLSVPEYGLYEIHENGDERKLSPDERPIFVQLEWNKDDREGRFLLRRMDEKTRELTGQTEEPSLRRALSKKEKKKQEKLRKQQQKEQEKADAAANKLAAKNKNGIAERLYNELPETSFTRSISNPEAVMKRRRAQKLEKRLQEFSLEGGQEAGGTLRIFGETINKDVSYKTLLLSTKDTASYVVKQILEKYGKDDEDPSNYCLVQLIVPPSAASTGGDNNSVHDLNTSSALRESILDDQDCPLLMNQNHDKSRGILTFHIRRKPADYQKRRRKKTPRAPAQQSPLHPLMVQQLNQRLHINNNSEFCRDQNSPQNSSQTSGSIVHDQNNVPPPTFETVQSMPNMFPPKNMMHYSQPSNQINTSTLPMRMNNHHQNNMPDMGGTMQRSISNQPQSMNQPNKQFHPQHPTAINRYPSGQPLHQYVPTGPANDPILPALIQVKEDVEDLFLSRVITHIKPTDVAFRLAPTYVLYMVSRYRASTLFHPELQAPSRAELFVPFTKKIATMIRNAIDLHIRDPVYLAFWLANSSDLSHFYKQDKHLSHFTIDAQEILYDSIKASFKYLLSCKQLELDGVLHTFFEEDDDVDQLDNGTNRPNQVGVRNMGIGSIIDVLNETMATMRKNRVNAALTIQIFSHLFHHISKWLFDRLIGAYDHQQNIMAGQPNFSIYCNRVWGEKLNTRLAIIGGWAQKQGLEQAADFHLAKVSQVTLFLARRYSQRVYPQDLKDACDSCDRLNPVQLRALLQRYQPETPTLRQIIDNLLYTMDYSYMAGDYPLGEDFELKIPFLIPEDGYSSEMIRFVPPGLVDFVSYLSKIRVRDQELCIFTVQPTSSGFWTVYFKNYHSDAPEIIVLQLRKKNNSMGLSIIAARGVGQERLGIYIKNVVKNGAAASDGRLQAGDQLLEVDGNSLLDITQESAAELMQRTGPVVTLKIAKQAAIYHNLSDIINSVPSQTLVSNQAMIPQNIGNRPIEVLPSYHQERKMMQPHIQPMQSMDRHYPPSQQIEVQQDQRVMQYPQDRQPHSLPVHHSSMQNRPINLEAPNKILRQPMPERQVHFEPPPPPPVTMYDETQQPTSLPTNSTHSPLKSPKKVSWVDTQPHQSLHTLIPPSPSLAPSPPMQENLHDIGQSTMQPDDYMDDNENMNTNKNYHHQQMVHNNQLTEIDNRTTRDERQHQYIDRDGQKGHNDNDDDIDEDDEEDDDDDGHNRNEYINNADQRSSEPLVSVRIDDDSMDQNNGTKMPPNTNGQPDPSESLTLEDIDEVLSSKSHNNWLEDSAGVIGTQEVYNDPRQRIVKERERPNEADVNIEKLSFQEKLKMFNISARK